MPYGQIDRFKARLVVRGFTQIYGQDYDETFAPIMRKESLRMIFAISALNGWHVHSMDVDNAFLVSDLEEEIYMEIPEGIE
jgi:ABC-type lipoprotein release transport system permease subunit